MTCFALVGILAGRSFDFASAALGVGLAGAVMSPALLNLGSRPPGALLQHASRVQVAFRDVDGRVDTRAVQRIRWISVGTR
jgi:hypothetical protein